MNQHVTVCSLANFLRANLKCPSKQIEKAFEVNIRTA